MRSAVLQVSGNQRVAGEGAGGEHLLLMLQWQEGGGKCCSMKCQASLRRSAPPLQEFVMYASQAGANLVLCGGLWQGGNGGNGLGLG